MLRAIANLTPKEIRLIFYAWILMIAAAVAVRFFSFPILRSLASRPLKREICNPDHQVELARETRAAISMAARRSPLRALCFEKGLVAQILLRRRGVPSVLYYGLKQEQDKQLEAHVWVMVGDFPVCGEGVADQFVTLTKIPHDAQQRVSD